ncbi:hypothetical protein [Bathymodiolus thermophilus thioautotrophic gill symbiont]|uniref:Uncharacterized protein n=1 Tax=Bathymodiolus thermophilus thioautotrophic gill symbiont TaxID=2360 RepID=A0A1J5TU86_9GAMM|nr:hypothetical protein [Bathymodiolus thermophilus thioautotrophic gill symbiont]OIR24378.1 hypothetical protein BGC33_03370 [Bathymodiolus thermophilus thioautotrophic gill symbiont]CAB5506004.1 hypothetical protein THERMOS_2226 [Bathymodiolus thermophilus thioautotrophic gill symbiont]
MIYKTLFAILLAIGVISSLLSSWHIFFTFKEIKPEKKLKANLLAPFSMFLPDLYTKKGNHHRVLALRYIAIFSTCFFLLFALQEFK